MVWRFATARGSVFYIPCPADVRLFPWWPFGAQTLRFAVPLRPWLPCFGPHPYRARSFRARVFFFARMSRTRKKWPPFGMSRGNGTPDYCPKKRIIAASWRNGFLARQSRNLAARDVARRTSSFFRKPSPCHRCRQTQNSAGPRTGTTKNIGRHNDSPAKKGGAGANCDDKTRNSARASLCAKLAEHLALVSHRGKEKWNT